MTNDDEAIIREAAELWLQELHNWIIDAASGEDKDALELQAENLEHALNRTGR